MREPESIASLYLHIPFCLAKCRYCAFSSHAGRESLYQRYVAALQHEIARCGEQHGAAPLETVFFGGGTPTILAAEQLAAILSTCRSTFSFAEGAEISIEANPGTIGARKLAHLREAGFNRLSIGIQSFDDGELATLGRCHSARQGVDSVHMARLAGFSSISMDLMYGIPGQGVESWRRNLDRALSLGPDHLSLYQLTVEDGTAFADMVDAGQLSLPEEDEVLAMDEYNLAATEEAGLTIYEVSNFSRPGHRCRHNVNYWQNGSYLAAGAGAVSCVQGCRQRRLEEPKDYCRAVEGGTELFTETERLCQEKRFRETVIMGLRMSDGVELQALEARFGLWLPDYYGVTLQKLLAGGFLELSRSHLRVSARGRLLANAILAELV